MRLCGQSFLSRSLLSSSREISLIAWPDLPSGYRTPPAIMSQRLSQALYLRIDVEKGRETRLKLLLDLVFTALESVHGDVRLAPIFQFDWRLADRVDLIGRQQTQAVNQCQICHPTIVSQRTRAGSAGGAPGHPRPATSG